MTSSRERILEMVAQGNITAEEAEALLAALDGKRPSKWQLLVNPFDRLGSAMGLVLAILAAVASIGLTLLNVRFDGTLDLHVVAKSVPLLQGVVDQGAAWICTSLVLWLTALAFARRGRFIDFLTSTGVARIPMVLGGLGAGLILSNPAQLAEQLKHQPITPGLMITLLVVLPCLIWFVTLLFFGFRTASGLKGGKLAVGFIAAMLMAEILSKAMLYVVRLS